MTNLLISVIIPIYNVEEYLDECVQSVINQTYENLDIILVDDGSTDTSGKICDKYGDLDKRIQVIHKKNGGLSDARNAGLLQAKGDIIGFVDGDDYIDKEMYQTLYNLLLENACDIAYCTYQKIGEEDVYIPTKNVEVLSKEEALTYYVKGYKNYRMSPAVWQRIFKKEVIADFKFPVGICYEDLVWGAQVYNQCEKVVFVDEQLYYYRIRKNSITGKDYNNAVSKRVITDHLKQYKNEINFLSEIKREDLARVVQYQYFYKITECIYNIKRYRSEELYSYIPMLKSERKKLKRWTIINFKYIERLKEKILLLVTVFFPYIYYKYTIIKMKQ